MAQKEELTSLKNEVANLEKELKQVQDAPTTKKRCQELAKYVKENETADQLIRGTPQNPFTQTQGGGHGCCG